MPAPTNLSFETAGATAGLAASWTITSSAAYHYADFLISASAQVSWDSFEGGWFSNESFYFTLTASTSAVFTSVSATPRLVETFEDKWLDDPGDAATSNEYFEFAFGGGTSGEFAGAFIASVDSVDTPYTDYGYAESTLSCGSISGVGRVRVTATFSDDSGDVSYEQGYQVYLTTPDGGNDLELPSFFVPPPWFTTNPVTRRYDLTDFGFTLSPTIGVYQLIFTDSFGAGTYITIDSWTVAFYAANVTAETFESDWGGVNNYFTSLALAGSVGTTFVPSSTGQERFETGWNTNENFQFTLGANTSALFTIPTGTEAFEKFENPYTPIAITGVNTGTNVLTVASVHGLVATRRVMFVRGAGALPAPLIEAREYIVDSVSLTTTALALLDVTSGATVDLTTAGDATNYLIGSLNSYWGTPQSF